MQAHQHLRDVRSDRVKSILIAVRTIFADVYGGDEINTDRAQRYLAGEKCFD